MNKIETAANEITKLRSKSIIKLVKFENNSILHFTKVIYTKNNPVSAQNPLVKKISRTSISQYGSFMISCKQTKFINYAFLYICMGRRGISETFGGMSETGNWNVADDFARVKIMIPLAKCEYYEDIAKFGFEAIEDEIINYQVPVEVVKFKGLTRLVEELLKICKNAKFALKKRGTKEQIKKYEKILEDIKKVLPGIIQNEYNSVRKTNYFGLDNEKFNKVMKVTLEIKSSINDPLNRNHLIFVDKEEETEEEFKKRIEEELMTG